MSIEFFYRNQPYYALINIKMRDGRKAYYVNILKDERERLLYCQNIIFDEDGSVRAREDISSSELSELKESIIVMLWQRLHENAFAN